MYKAIAITTAVVVVTLLILVAIGLWVLSRSFHHSEILRVPLPHQIGGTMPVEIDIDMDFDTSTLEISSALHLKVHPEDINALVPTKEFSLLLQDFESPTIVSLLGSLIFVPDSAVIDGADGQINVGVGISGDFYVREQRNYERDEEQPGGGDRLPYAGSAVLTLNQIRLAPSWQLEIGSQQLDLRLDEPTRAAWRGRYGNGDYLAELVEQILTTHANELLAQIETDSGQLRSQLEEVLNSHSKESLDNGLGHVRLHLIEVDNCPVVDQEDVVSFSFAARARIDETALPRFELPDLTVRDGPCTI